MERARLLSLRGSTCTAPFSIFTATSLDRTTSRAPFGPFIFTVWPSTFAVTPVGMATAFLPIRDMSSFLVSPLQFAHILVGEPVPTSPEHALEHRAQDFAADIGVARLVIGHHTLGRGDDRDAEAVVDARQRLHRGVDAPAGLRDPLNLPDHRGAVEILELDLDFV